MLTFRRGLVDGDMALLEENLQHRFKLILADLTRESKVDLNMLQVIRLIIPQKESLIDI